MRNIRISTFGCPSDYSQSLLPIITQSLGYHLDWVSPKNADLLILGPFVKPDSKGLRWCPKPLRPLFHHSLDLFPLRKVPPLRVFHSAENLRNDFISADYSISFDLNVSSKNHFRLPYWMETIDWSSEGIVGNQNPRYGQLLTIDRLMQPLGKQFLERKKEAIFLSSHFREPRKTVFETVKNVMPITGVGPYFNKNIKSHHKSGFLKKVLLQEFGFNLCPENSMHPGYYTEKIPEAFFAGCLPIGWADENIKVDFNPEAFINLAPMSWCNFKPLREIINSPRILERYSTQPLLLEAPSILPFRDFVKRILADAYS
jgi:Glycosyltransferase family 10 (fucosyltransferase) C-term/Alpha-(1,3)-fucosyltransferase FucT N-terminal domain